MPKGLRLKKTPAEKVERDMRRARKAAKKAAHRQYRAYDADLHSGGRSSKRSRSVEDNGVDMEPPFPDPGSSTPHYNARTVPVEEESFQEKLWDALRDDERLDGIEAGLNEYAYIPRRWRGVSSRDSPDNVGGLGDDPNLMNDDEYAEWMRTEMWRYVLPRCTSPKENFEKRVTDAAMLRHIVRRSGKGPLTLRRRLRLRGSSRLRRMPVGARDMSENVCDTRKPEMPMNGTGLRCSVVTQNLQISASEIYPGRCRAHHQTFHRLRLRLFLRSCSSLETKNTMRPREGGFARRNLEGRF